MQASKILTGVGLFGLLCASTQAAPLSGTFNLSGTVTVTASTMSWKSDQSPGFAANMFSLTAGTGSFSTENGQNGIADLNISAEPVGPLFAPVPFITFAVSALPALEIDFIYSGTASSALCNTPPASATPGQTCTPANPGGSPFTFQNNPPPNSPQSSADWVFGGVSSDGQSTWIGNFTSQFPVSFQQVLQAFQNGGSGEVTNSYSGTVTVTPTPEPAPLAMLAAGLGLLALWRSGYKRSRR